MSIQKSPVFLAIAKSDRDQGFRRRPDVLPYPNPYKVPFFIS